MFGFARRLRRALVTRRQCVYDLQHPERLRRIAPRVPVELAEVSPDNVGDVVGFRGPDVAEAFAGFLRDDGMGLYALIDSRVVGHAWATVCHARPRRGNRYVGLRPQEALVHYCRVANECRGNAIYQAMLSSLVHRLFAEGGVRRVIVDTERGNAAARRAIEKVGFEPVGCFAFILIAGRPVLRRRLPWP